MWAWLLVGPALAADVCASGCDFASLQAAIDAVTPGVVGLVRVQGPVWQEEVVVDGGRRVLLTLAGTEPVTLSAGPPAEAVVTVRGGSQLDMVGVSVYGDLVRAADVSGGSRLTVTLGAFLGRGVLGDGALVRLRDSSLYASVAGFSDGFSGGDGGLIHAVDSDVELLAVTMTGGSASRGGALYASASGTRRSLTLDGVTLLDNTAVAGGGALYVEGEVDVDILAAVFDGGSATEGGVLATGPGDGPDIRMEATDIDGATAFGPGGAIAHRGGRLRIVDSNLRGLEALQGGGIASWADLELDAVYLRDGGSVGEGGGVAVLGGTATLVDVSLGENTSAVGGGLYVGPDAQDVDLVRVLVCGNQALDGGGIAVDGTSVDLEWRNVRVLDNEAVQVGGGILHRGGGTLALRHVNLLGNGSGQGGGAALVADGDVELDHTLVGWSTGGVAVRRGEEALVELGPTAWWENGGGHLVDLTPGTPGAVFEDPLLVGYTPGVDCDTARDWFAYTSPLRDAGEPTAPDPDGSDADIGAFGGPDADPVLWQTDADADGTPLLFDCDDRDPAVNPEAPDAPYDGLDANCDRADDFDADGDGDRSILHGGTDCDDSRADIYPGAPEVPGAGVDHNCDGVLDADLDGYTVDDDCDDGDPDAHPGAAEDDDPSTDLDCDGFVDLPRALVPVGCATGPPGPWAPGLLLLLLLARRGPSAGARARGGAGSAPTAPGRRTGTT